MANAQDYPITQGYGYDPSYPLNNGWHKGVDYGCPTGTPVVVNGVTIGLSGATGAVTGPHLHVGRWVGGVATDPGRGGTNFNSAVVTEVGTDKINGNFVRVQGDGASWVYLHLSKHLATKGQTLTHPKEDIVKPSEADVYSAFNQFAGQPPSSPDQVQYYMNRDIRDLYHDLMFFEIIPKPAEVEEAFKKFSDTPINTPPYTDQTIYYSSRPAKFLYQDLATALKNKAPVETGGIDQATKDQIAETNNIVKQIWNKISGVFK